MAVIETEGLSHRYGRLHALRDVDLRVPEGAVYALLGPNGAGKTTLLHILAGLLRPTRGRSMLLGRPSEALTPADRASIGYVAEGQRLPGGMTLERLERYLAPLHPRWDPALAAELRTRFRLAPDRRIDRLSRGERMKAAVLCALAPRPRLLLMDEPFAGMDARVKDELVRGVLARAGEEGWTVLVSSHDIAEVEILADRVGILDGGRLVVSESLDVLRERFRRVEVVRSGETEVELPSDWRSVEEAGPRLTFLVAHPGPGLEEALRRRFPGAKRIETRGATLREIFLALSAGGAERPGGGSGGGGWPGAERGAGLAVPAAEGEVVR